jgi:hypothetical protein
MVAALLTTTLRGSKAQDDGGVSKGDTPESLIPLTTNGKKAATKVKNRTPRSFP